MSTLTPSQFLYETLAQQVAVSVDKVTPTADLFTDLGFDSLDILETIMAVEEHFQIEIDEQAVEQVHTVAEAEALLLAVLSSSGVKKL